MICNCGSELGADANFCSQCGARVLPVDAVGITFGRFGEVIGAEKAQRAKDLAKTAAGVVSAGVRTDMGKSVAAGAALGAVIALPIPFVGPVFGAAVGAALGAFRKF